MKNICISSWIKKERNNGGGNRPRQEGELMENTHNNNNYSKFVPPSIISPYFLYENEKKNPNEWKGERERVIYGQ